MKPDGPGPSPSPDDPGRSAPIVLTGATGFIGRRLQHSLLEAGFKVRAVLQPGSRNSRFLDPRCTRVDCALDDRATLARTLHGTQAVIYCAGSVRGRSLDDFLPANVRGVRTILQAQSIAAPAAPFLLISSLAAERPELSDYARSKHLGEAAVHGGAPGPWTILRPPAVYGPGDREMRALFGMARRGLILHAGPRDQRASLLHVDDLVAAIRAWLKSWPACSGRMYTLDDGQPGGYAWSAIAAAAGRDRILQVRVPGPLLDLVAWLNLLASRPLRRQPMLTPGKVRELTEARWLCDNSAFASATGWQPRIDLATGLALTRECDGR